MRQAAVQAAIISRRHAKDPSVFCKEGTSKHTARTDLVVGGGDLAPGISMEYLCKTTARYKFIWILIETRGV